MLPKRPLILLISALAASTLSAQVTAGAKQSPSAPDFSKEAYVIEELRTRITAEQDGTGARESVAKIKLLAEAGVKAFAVLNFTYTSANEVVEIDYVRVRKPDGTVVKTPDYNIQDMPGEVSRTAPMYSDVHEKHIAVKGLGVGDLLEYSIRRRIVTPQVPGHFWTEYSFSKMPSRRMSSWKSVFRLESISKFPVRSSNPRSPTKADAESTAGNSRN